jgi:hypothetical protein
MTEARQHGSPHDQGQPMSAPDQPADGLINKGFIVNHPPVLSPGRGGKTFIVTGLHRSGTSLVASVLRQAGIFMGSEINDIVHEDEAIAKLLIGQDRDGLKRLIGERNATYGTWGFKFPMICQSLGPEDMALFSDPHMIVTFRDPVSVAVRTSLSEYQDPMRALRTSVDDLAAIVSFADQVPSPSLLLSYEKSLMFPGDFIDAIARFCGLPQSGRLRERLIQVIEPNRPAYIAQSRRRYEGVIDGVTGGSLYGWCRLTGIADPVALELFADDRPVLSFAADVFRQDLLDAGFGTGNHGFYVDLRTLDLRPESIIRIKVAVRGIELDNSARRLEAYGG